MNGRQTIIAADIGGTNCRLGHFAVRDGRLGLLNHVWVSSDGLANTADLLAAMEQALDIAVAKADIVAIALAGPILDGRQGRLTNGQLAVSLDLLEQSCPQSHCLLLNDFTAQAFSCLLPDETLARTAVSSHKNTAGKPSCASRAAIGAGTGLGAASLVFCGAANKARPWAGWQAIASEVGHTAFPFVAGNMAAIPPDGAMPCDSRDEMAFHSFVCQKLQVPFATCEDVLSARGLVILHEFLTGKRLEAPEVAAAALQAESPTLAWYARFYGRFARNWILATLCAGGLCICGGIAAKNPLVVTGGHFMSELCRPSASCPEHLAKLLGETPVSLATDENCGLWGAAQAGLCQ